MNGRARILFVDDEKRVLNSMRGLFRRDFELFLTTEGASAVKIASENAIDVVVADQRMPGMTGIEVLGKVKELSPHTVRILLTGYADPSAVEGSINIGEVFRFLSKPCPPRELRETLRLAVEAARASAAANAEKKRVDTTPVPPPVAPRALPASPAPVAAKPELPKLNPVPPAARPLSGRPAAPVQNIPQVTPFRPRKIDSGETGSHWQTITDVVLAGDTSKETTQSHFSRMRSSKAEDVGVVIFTVDSLFAEASIRAVSADRNTTLATTLAKVAQAIEQHAAGVLVTDFTTNSAVLQKMISALKQHLPELVTIVVSGARDTTDMIALINHGQIFRYIMKPVEPQDLRREITSAAVRHLHLLNNPESVTRHRVVNLAGRTNSSQTLNQFLSRIQKLRAGQYDPTDSSV